VAYQTRDLQWRVDVRTVKGRQVFEVRFLGGLMAVLDNLPGLEAWLVEHAGVGVAELTEC
jgi:hypothetical protein